MNDKRHFGPFEEIETITRKESIIKYLSSVTNQEYNEQPLSIRQAMEFIFDFIKGENEMEIVATCECGCQAWIIYINRIACRSCNKSYYVDKDTSYESIINKVNNQE
jgi:hypothetical protein